MPRRRRTRGVALLLALFFLVLFSAVMCEVIHRAATEVTLSDNDARSHQALALAESGLTLARYALLEDPQWQGGSEVELPGHAGTIALSVDRYRTDSDLTYDDRIRVTSEAQVGPAVRRVRMEFAHEEAILSYGIVARSRLIITGDTVINGRGFSTWDRQDVAPALVLEEASETTGTLGTVYSKDEFDDSHIEGAHGGLVYDTEPFTAYTADDFDTSSYRDGTSAIPPAGDRDWERWPPDKWNGKWFQRDTYEAETYTNGRLPSGRHARFEDCTFNGITYIDAPNNVVFENCTFNGPIITAVPDTFRWQDQALTFEEGNVWNNDAMVESTILAPNFNINIGNLDEVSGENTIRGLLVGGIVDLRGNINVDGTILSMYYPDPDRLGSSARLYGTNIGYYDMDAESTVSSDDDRGRIRITTRPEYGLPIGVETRYTTVPMPETYQEL